MHADVWSEKKTIDRLSLAERGKYVGIRAYVFQLWLFISLLFRIFYIVNIVTSTCTGAFNTEK